MSGRRIILAAAAALLVVSAAMPEPAAAKNPWEVVKDWWSDKSPFKKKQRTPRAVEKPEKGDPNDKKEEVATAPAVIAPIPRPRPQRGPQHPRDFDAAFVPPPVLTIPPDPELAPGEEAPALAAPATVAAAPAAPAAMPEVIPLGPPGVGEKSTAAFPFPHPKPKLQLTDVEPLAMLPVEPPPPPFERPTEAQISKCMTSLATLGVEADRLAPVVEGTCGIAMPASVGSFEKGVVKLPVKALISCQLAETTARWLHDTVQPAALAELNGPVNGLRIAASYDCRTRDRIPGEKLSEHAFGNALDLAAFRVNGRWIEVGGQHDDRATAFLTRIRGEACGPFKTVLGPGSDSYHTDHLHLDLATRRTAGPSKGLYCK